MQTGLTLHLLRGLGASGRLPVLRFRIASTPSAFAARLGIVCPTIVAAIVPERLTTLFENIEKMTSLSLNGSYFQWREFHRIHPVDLHAPRGTPILPQDRQRFTIAFRELVFREAGARKLHAQPIGDLVAGSFAGFLFAMDDAVGIVSDQRKDVGILECFDIEGLTPKLDR
jgi:hypothetical protein